MRNPSLGQRAYFQFLPGLFYGSRAIDSVLVVPVKRCPDWVSHRKPDTWSIFFFDIRWQKHIYELHRALQSLCLSFSVRRQGSQFYVISLKALQRLLHLLPNEPRAAINTLDLHAFWARLKDEGKFRGNLILTPIFLEGKTCIWDWLCWRLHSKDPCHVSLLAKLSEACMRFYWQ